MFRKKIKRAKVKVDSREKEGGEDGEEEEEGSGDEESDSDFFRFAGSMVQWM